MYHLNNVLKRGNKYTVLIIHILPTYHKHFVVKRSRHASICVVMVGKTKRNMPVNLCLIRYIPIYVILEYEKVCFRIMMYNIPAVANNDIAREKKYFITSLGIWCSFHLGAGVV